MDEARIRQLIEAEVRKLLRQGAPEPAPSGREVAASGRLLLAVFCGAKAALPTALAQTRQLAGAGFTITAVLSPAAGAVVGEGTIRSAVELAGVVRAGAEADLMKLSAAAEAAVVPVLSRNTAAKLAAGITDTVAASAIMYALAQGKPVVAARNGADPDDPECFCSGLPTMPTALRRELLAHLDALASYGVTLVDANDLAAEVLRRLSASAARASGDRRLITERDVMEAAEAGRDIVLSRGTIITPAARDAALRRGVRIVEPGD